MKKQNIIFTLLMCLFIGTSLNAQDEKPEKKGNLFVRANLGYGFQGVREVQGVNQDLTQGTNIYGSSAPGFTFGGGVGYMFNKYIGLELGLTYSVGTEKLSEVIADPRPLGVQAAGLNFDLLTAYVFQEYTHKTSQLRIIPAVVIRGGDGKVTPYAKVGLVVPVAGKTKTSVVGKLSSTAIEIPAIIPDFLNPIPDGVSLAGSVSADAESKGQFSMGFDATLGADYKITDKISIFGELNLVALTIKSRETKVSRYDGEYGLDGTDLLSLEDLVNTIQFIAPDFSLNSLGLYENIDDVPLSEKHFIYTDQLTASSNNAAFNSEFDENKALDDYARRDSYSSVGINVGVKFNF